MDMIHTDKFAKRVDGLIQKHHVPGLAIAITHNDGIASAGFGYASIDRRQRCTADTLFDIASASKSLTAASVSLLINDDNHPDLTWESTMSSILPDDFVMSTKEHTNMVTVEDVLSHRTGLPRHDDSIMGIEAEFTNTAKSITRILRHLPVSAPVRTKYHYCNLMYTVATHLVEHLSGLEFPEFLDEKIFKPLDMHSTNLQPGRARSKGLECRMTQGHCWNEDSSTYHHFWSPHSPEGQGAGSIITSVNDYIKYVKALMNKEGPFTEAVYEGLIKWRIPTETSYKSLRPYTSPPLYAAGWEVRWYRGHLVVAHDGFFSGYATTHFFLPDLKFGGVIFGNSGGAATVHTILTHELIDEVLNVPKDQRADWDKVEEDLDAESDDEDVEELKRQLCPNPEDLGPLTTPLSAYVGKYHHAGYRNLKVEVKDGKLFINGSDRSMPFTLTFEHVCDQTKFIAHLTNINFNDDIPFRAEFELTNGKAVRLGLHIEEDIKEYIFFDRVSS